MMKIYLSPSNQDKNMYAAGNTTECDQCNRIAEYAEIALKRNGYEVKRAPKGQDMYVSIRESNNWGADLHIPIHTNAGGGSGTVVFVYAKGAKNLKYADPIYAAIQAITPGTVDYGIRAYPDLAELNATTATAVYCECEFHDNSTLAQWIIDHVEDLGEAICKGVCRANDKTYIAKKKPKPAPANVFYRVQVGAYNEYANAVKMQDELKSKGYNPIIVEVKK